MESFHLHREKSNKLFPFFILINEDLRVLDYGESLKKLIPQTHDLYVKQLFTLVRPGTEALEFESLKEATDMLAVIKLHDAKGTALRGQFEILPENQLLFVGSPWFNSIEAVHESNLSLADFAYHDQLVDLLHLIKSQEITTGELKQLLKTVSDQKNHLLNNERTLKLLSQIAEDNVNAVVISDVTGNIMWANHSFSKMTGYSPNEYLGKRPGKLLQGKNSNQEIIAYLKNQVHNQQPFTAELINYTKEGKEYWVRLQGQPFVDEKDEFSGYFAIEENITREREIQDKLLDSERKLRLALEKIGDNVWEHDFVTDTTKFSRDNNEFIGSKIPSEKNQARQWWSHVHKDDVQTLIENDRKVRSGECDSHSLRYRMIREDGAVRWVLDRGVVIEKDAGGLPLKIIGTHTDITKIKETEAELANRVSQFKSLSENIPGVIYEYVFKKDGSEYMQYVSPSMETVFGISAKEFQENSSKYIHPEDVGKIRMENAKAKITLQRFNVEARLVLPDQRIIWHQASSAFAHQTEEGDLIFTGIMLNTTDRKNAEDALKVNEEKYRNIISNMNLGLLEVTPDDTITFANDSFGKLTGYSVSELIGKKAHDLFLVDQVEREKVASKTEIRQKGFSDAYEVRMYDRNKQPHWVMISGAPRYNDKGEFVGSLGIHIDVTEQKKLQDLLIKAKEEALHLASVKEQFLANMSHEIRTPLNAIIGMVRELKYSNLDPEQAKYVRNAEISSDHLLSLINDILDLSKISSGNLELDHCQFLCNDLCDEVKSITQKLADDKRIDLIFENKLIDNRSYFGDPGRIRQIMINVISNAVKFTEKGFVKITCENGKANETNDELVISVMDTGIGMDESFLKTIFDKFSQENTSVQRRFGGTGLGMSITKQLVDMMHGSIDVKSEKGKGTEFVIRLWLERSNEGIGSKAFPLPEDISLAGKRILVVEDNEMNRLVANSLLVRNKMVASFAENGRIGVEKALAEKFDLILMDMQMPVMDGVEATQEIRLKGITTPIVALTANALKAEIDKALQAGMDDFVSKPFEEAVLLQKMKNALQKTLQNIKSKPTQKKEIAFTESSTIIDETYLDSISGDNDEFKKQIFQLFQKQSSDFVEQADTLLKAQLWKELASLAHQFKPQGSYLGASGLTTLISVVEAESRGNKNEEVIADHLAQARQWIEKINREIDSRLNPK